MFSFDFVHPETGTGMMICVAGCGASEHTDWLEGRNSRSTA